MTLANTPSVQSAEPYAIGTLVTVDKDSYLYKVSPFYSVINYLESEDPIFWYELTPINPQVGDLKEKFIAQSSELTTFNPTET